jgi:hypothetical protein
VCIWGVSRPGASARLTYQPRGQVIDLDRGRELAVAKGRQLHKSSIIFPPPRWRNKLATSGKGANSLGSGNSGGEKGSNFPSETGDSLSSKNHFLVIGGESIQERSEIDGHNQLKLQASLSANSREGTPDTGDVHNLGLAPEDQDAGLFLATIDKLREKTWDTRKTDGNQRLAVGDEDPDVFSVTIGKYADHAKSVEGGRHAKSSPNAEQTRRHKSSISRHGDEKGRANVDRLVKEGGGLLNIELDTAALMDDNKDQTSPTRGQSTSRVCVHSGERKIETSGEREIKSEVLFAARRGERWTKKAEDSDIFVLVEDDKEITAQDGKGERTAKKERGESVAKIEILRERGTTRGRDSDVLRTTGADRTVQVAHGTIDETANNKDSWNWRSNVVPYSTEMAADNKETGEAKDQMESDKTVMNFTGSRSAGDSNYALKSDGLKAITGSVDNSRDESDGTMDISDGVVVKQDETVININGDNDVVDTDYDGFPVNSIDDEVKKDDGKGDGSSEMTDDEGVYDDGSVVGSVADDGKMSPTRPRTIDQYRPGSNQYHHQERDTSPFPFVLPPPLPPGSYTPTTPTLTPSPTSTQPYHYYGLSHPPSPASSQLNVLGDKTSLPNFGLKAQSALTHPLAITREREGLMDLPKSSSSSSLSLSSSSLLFMPNVHGGLSSSLAREFRTENDDANTWNQEYIAATSFKGDSEQKYMFKGSSYSSDGVLTAQIPAPQHRKMQPASRLASSMRLLMILLSLTNTSASQHSPSLPHPHTPPTTIHFAPLPYKRYTIQDLPPFLRLLTNSPVMDGSIKAWPGSGESPADTLWPHAGRWSVSRGLGSVSELASRGEGSRTDGPIKHTLAPRHHQQAIELKDNDRLSSIDQSAAVGLSNEFPTGYARPLNALNSVDSATANNNLHIDRMEWQELLYDSVSMANGNPALENLHSEENFQALKRRKRGVDNDTVTESGENVDNVTVAELNSTDANNTSKSYTTSMTGNNTENTTAGVNGTSSAVGVEETIANTTQVTSGTAVTFEAMTPSQNVITTSSSTAATPTSSSSVITSSAWSSTTLMKAITSSTVAPSSMSSTPSLFSSLSSSSPSPTSLSPQPPPSTTTTFTSAPSVASTSSLSTATITSSSPSSSLSSASTVSTSRSIATENDISKTTAVLPSESTTPTSTKSVGPVITSSGSKVTSEKSTVDTATDFSSSVLSFTSETKLPQGWTSGDNTASASKRTTRAADNLSSRSPTPAASTAGDTSSTTGWTSLFGLDLTTAATLTFSDLLSGFSTQDGSTQSSTTLDSDLMVAPTTAAPALMGMATDNDTTSLTNNATEPEPYPEAERTPEPDPKAEGDGEGGAAPDLDPSAEGSADQANNTGGSDPEPEAESDAEPGPDWGKAKVS